MSGWTSTWLLRQSVPDRARRHLQFALILAARHRDRPSESYLRGSQAAVKALLLRNYGANLALIIAVTLVLYAASVARDRTHTSSRPTPLTVY